MTKSPSTKSVKPPRRLSGVKKIPAKRLKTSSAKRGGKRKRLPLSLIRAKRLGYECRNLTDADAVAGLSQPLAGVLDKYPKIRAAWQRGQFLRNLELEAGSAPNLPRAANHLGYKNGEELSDLLDDDPEAKNIWKQARLDLNVKQNKRVFDLAAEGSKWCIQLVEKFLTTDEGRPAAIGGTDLKKLMQKQVADLFDVTRVTVKDWTDRQGMPRNADGTYDLAAVVRWWKVFINRRAGAGVPAADKMRDLKTEAIKLDLLERKGQLLDRGEVIAGLVARFQNMVGAFQYKRRELANMVHNQTIENIEDILSRFFEDLQRQQLEVPEVLRLSPEGNAKLGDAGGQCKARRAF
jgi:phage terminase Nu1 subunit (DNA packaging protein)